MRSVPTWAGVPVLSVGLIFLLAELMTAIGSPFGVPAFVGLVVRLSTALVVRTQRDRTAITKASPTRSVARRACSARSGSLRS
jgi:hypothetical protein